jgi:hypothetical protein
MARLAMCALKKRPASAPDFGRESPYLDIRLTCGSRIEIWVERILADDMTIDVLLGRVASKATHVVAA